MRSFQLWSPSRKVHHLILPGLGVAIGDDWGGRQKSTHTVCRAGNSSQEEALDWAKGFKLTWHSGLHSLQFLWWACLEGPKIGLQLQNSQELWTSKIRAVLPILRLSDNPAERPPHRGSSLEVIRSPLFHLQLPSASQILSPALLSSPLTLTSTRKQAGHQQAQCQYMRFRPLLQELFTAPQGQLSLGSGR